MVEPRAASRRARFAASRSREPPIVGHGGIDGVVEVEDDRVVGGAKPPHVRSRRHYALQDQHPAGTAGREQRFDIVPPWKGSRGNDVHRPPPFPGERPEPILHLGSIRPAGGTNDYPVHEELRFLVPDGVLRERLMPSYPE